MKKFNLSLAALLVAAATTATAGVSVENEMGTLNFGGDVEYDIDYRNTGKEDKETIGQGGRILLDLNGQRVSASGYEAEFKAQPVVGPWGVGLDDAMVSIGKVDGWNVKVGRFEAYDMFPNGQDTVMGFAGDTSNENINANAPYIYQMKEARGRHDGGQIMYSESFGNTYVEVATLLGERTRINVGNQTTDSLMVRPVVAQQMGDLKVAFALESDLTGKVEVSGKEFDLSERLGYGVTGTYSIDGLSASMNLAKMDGIEEESTSFAANVNLSGLGLGYYLSANSYTSNENLSGISKGDLTVQSAYVSYEMVNVLGMDGFNVYPGAYFSTIDADSSTGLESEDDLGLRLRLKYFF